MNDRDFSRFFKAIFGLAFVYVVLVLAVLVVGLIWAIGQL